MFGIGECVFDGGADCIHECHQGPKLAVGYEDGRIGREKKGEALPTQKISVRVQDLQKL